MINGSPARFSPINWNYWNVHILSYLQRSISIPTKETIWLMVWPHSMVWDGGLRLLRFPINQFQKAHIIRYLWIYVDSIWSTNNIRSQYSLFRWCRLWLRWLKLVWYNYAGSVIAFTLWFNAASAISAPCSAVLLISAKINGTDVVS